MRYGPVMPRNVRIDAPGILYYIIVRGIERGKISQPGSLPVKFKARSFFYYWAVRELEFTMADLAPKLNISRPAISMIAQSGEQIAPEYGYSQMDK